MLNWLKLRDFTRISQFLLNFPLPQNADPYITNWNSGNSLLSINVSFRAIGGKLDPILEGSKILEW